LPLELQSVCQSGTCDSNSTYSIPGIDMLRSYVYWTVHHFDGFGGLGVACWPLVPKFAGLNPAEAVGFLGRKNPQHAFLRRGSKAFGPML
jgi:hypothetical protein